MYILSPKRKQWYIGGLLITSIAVCFLIMRYWEHTPSHETPPVIQHTPPSQLPILTPQKRRPTIRNIRTNIQPYSDIVAVKTSLLLSTTPPDRFHATGTTDLQRRVSRLPHEDQAYDAYLVIPTLGLVAPTLHPTASRTATSKTIFASLDKAFLSGVAVYPDTAHLGTIGNSVIGGHSSYWARNPSHYKTIFTRLPELLPGDEIWGYTRDSAGTWEMTIYVVTASYYMKTFDPGIFTQSKEKKQVTLYTCVPIGTAKDRWIVRAEKKTE